jgi:outer membrane protein assembly factor BamA
MARQFIYLSLNITICLLSAFADEVDSTSARIIRSVRIEGNNVTQPYVILREMSLRAGDTLSNASAEKSQDRIYNLGLFNKVTIAHRDSADVTDIVVNVVERWYLWPVPIFSLRSRAINSASYGLQLMDQNFLGRNERVTAEYSTGYDRSAGLTYQTPRVKNNDDIYIGAMFRYRDSHSLDYNSDVLFEQINKTASFSLGRRIGYYQTLIGTVGYQMWELPDTSLGRTVSPNGTDRFVELGLDYTYDDRNIREYPTDGWYVDVAALNDGLGRESTVKNFRLATDVRTYASITDNLSLGLRGFGSFVIGGEVPMYHRIFLSSRLGIRGYNQRSFTGEELMGASAEVRVPVISPRFITLNFLDIHQFNTMRFGVYAALFADAGKIWFRSDNFNDVPWLASSGIGLHFLLPYSFILRTELSVNALGQIRLGANGGVAF